MQELRPGLWTWTAPHPSWSESGSKDEWGPEVRSYAYDSGACLVLFDPISPPTLVDRLVDAEAKDVFVVLTAEWHRRSADDCVERFGAHVCGAGEELPSDVEARRTYYDEELAYWIPRHRALVVGDSFLNEDGFRVQDEWLPRGLTAEQMREGLSALLELPTELVLVTHGEPVLEDAREALRAALERQVQEIAPGLRRWTARHPEWLEDVGSLALESDEGLILIDPIDPPRELRTPEHVLLTVFWHYRSTPDLKAEHVWASRRTVKALANRGVEVTEPIAAGDELPGGVRAFETARHGELVYWLAGQRTVVVGDVLLGAGAKPRPTADRLRLCPERWLGKATHDDLRESLRPLLDLPVQRVLVSHGEPVLARGREVLSRVIAA